MTSVPSTCPTTLYVGPGASFTNGTGSSKAIETKMSKVAALIARARPRRGSASGLPDAMGPGVPSLKLLVELMWLADRVPSHQARFQTLVFHLAVAGTWRRLAGGGYPWQLRLRWAGAAGSERPPKPRPKSWPQSGSATKSGLTPPKTTSPGFWREKRNPRGS